MYELTNVIRHNSEIGISETQSVPDPRLLGFFRQTVAIQIYLILFKNLFNSTWILQVGYRKGRGTRGKTVNIHWITEKAREFQKNIYFCCTDYAKAFDCVDYNKLWKILKEMGISDHITCLLRNNNLTCFSPRNKLEPDMKQWTGSKLGKEDIKII